MFTYPDHWSSNPEAKNLYFTLPVRTLRFSFVFGAFWVLPCVSGLQTLRHLNKYHLFLAMPLHSFSWSDTRYHSGYRGYKDELSEETKMAA